MQRLAAATKASTASNTEMPADQFCSRLADHLVIQWAWGKYSPQEIQLLAHLATRDMEALGLSEIPTSLTSLAALGSHGRHANNCHRDLIHYMKDQTHCKSICPLWQPCCCKQSCCHIWSSTHSLQNTRPIGRIAFCQGEWKVWWNFGSIWCLTLQCKTSKATDNNGRGGQFLWTFMATLYQL